MLPVSLTTIRYQYDRHRSRIELVYQYLTGQGLVQVLNILNGFFLLRWLSIDEQAKFSLAMGLQATISLLSDLGFGGSLLGLIGIHTTNKLRIGSYVAGIRFYKNRFLIISFLFGTLLTFAYYKKQHWGPDFLIIYVLILVGAYAQSSVSYYASLLQLNKNLKSFYLPQLILSGARLLITFSFFIIAEVNAVQVIILTTLSFVITTYWLKRAASIYFTEPAQSAIEIRQEIIKTLLPIAPMVFYYALQGQLNTFLVSYFGKSQNIAEVGALARLGQLFMLLNPFTSVVLLPYFARSSAHQVLRRSTTVLLIGVIITLPIISLAYLFPDLFLLLLGSKYYALKNEVGLFVLSTSLTYLSSILWSINLARKLNTWRYSLIYIMTTLVVQVWCISSFDLSKTHNVILLSFFVSLVSFVTYLFISILGYYRANTKEPIQTSLYEPIS